MYLVGENAAESSGRGQRHRGEQVQQADVFVSVCLEQGALCDREFASDAGDLLMEYVDLSA